MLMPDLKEPLSEREREILRLVATGAANKEIARQLVISPNTVKVHLRNIFAKIGVTSRTEATLYALQAGLVNPGAIHEGPQETDNGADGSPTGSPEAALPDGEGKSTAEARPRRSSIIQSMALLAVFALLLLGGWAVGSRLLADSGAQGARSPGAIPAEQNFSRWYAQEPLPEPRKGMGAVVYENTFFLIGGQTPNGIDGSVIRFNLADKSWQTLDETITPVTDVQAVLLGEKIYVPGGCLADGSATDQLNVFDPRQNIWESKAQLPAPRCAYALAAFEGQLFLFGGKDKDEIFDTVFAYNPQEDRWDQRTAMSSPRAYAGAIVVGGKIHLLGGFDGAHALDLHEIYTPTRDGTGEQPWEDASPLPAPRYAMGAAQLVNMIYLLGGAGEEGQDDAGLPLLFNAQDNQWMAFDRPPKEIRSLPALLAHGNMLYVIGGEGSSGISAEHQAYQAIYTIAVPLLQNEE